MITPRGTAVFLLVLVALAVPAETSRGRRHRRRRQKAAPKERAAVTFPQPTAEEEHAIAQLARDVGATARLQPFSLCGALQPPALTCLRGHPSTPDNQSAHPDRRATGSCSGSHVVVDLQPRELFAQAQGDCESGRFRDCFLKFDAVRRMAPEALEAHMNAAVALERMGSLDEALEMYRSALETAPSKKDRLQLAMASVLQRRSHQYHAKGETAVASM